MRQNKVLWFSVMLLLVTVLTGCGKKREVYSPQSFDEFSGHTVCVLEGSIQEDYVNKYLQGKDIDVKKYTSATDCMLAIKQGKADVFFGADLYAYNDAFHRQHLKICYVPTEIDGPFSYGLKKGNDALTDDLNVFIDSMMTTGDMQKIVDRWFDPNNLDYHNCVVIPPVSAHPEPGKKVLNVATSGVKPPAEVLIDNKWTGCEIEILQLYAASRNLSLNIEAYEFGNIIPALETGKADIGCSTIAINEERKAKINFAHKYTSLHAAFIIPDPDYVSEKTMWEQLKEDAYFSFVKENRWKLLYDGFWVTLLISVASLILGSLIGGGVCWLTMNRRRWLRAIGKIYLNLVRNIPMLVLLMIMFYVVFANAGLSTITVAIIAFGMNCGAYISEIYRTGIESVDRGQREAGLAMGFSHVQTFFYFIAPQAVKKALPVFKNEAVSLLKGTAIVGYISIMDLTKASDLIRSSSFEAFLPLIAISIIYFILAWVFTTVIDILIKRI